MKISRFFQRLSFMLERLGIIRTRKNETMNVYEECGVTFHKVLKRMSKNCDVTYSVFSVLSSIKLKEGYHLELQYADEISWGPTKLLYVIDDNSGERDQSILNYIRSNPSAMSAWQVYLLETSPLLWYRGYTERIFLFQKKPS